MPFYFVLQDLSHGINGTSINWFRHFDITITILLISVTVVGTHKLSHNMLICKVLWCYIYTYVSCLPKAIKHPAISLYVICSSCLMWYIITYCIGYKLYAQRYIASQLCTYIISMHRCKRYNNEVTSGTVCILGWQ